MPVANTGPVIEIDVQAEITIDGVDTGLQFSSLSVKQSLFNHCEIVVNVFMSLENPLDDLFEIAGDMLGKTIDITVFDNMNPGVKKAYTGIIHKVESEEVVSTIYAISEDFKLSVGKKHVSWTDKDVTSIVKDILSRSGINFDASGPSPSYNFQYFQQYDESDYHCLKRLANYDGCVFYHDGEIFAYGEDIGIMGDITLEEGEILDLSLEYKLQNSNFLSKSYDFNKHEKSGALEKKSSPFSPLDGNKYLKKVNDASKEVFKDNLEEIFSGTIKDNQDYEKFISARQNYVAGKMIVLRGVTNNPSVSIGKVITAPNTTRAPLKEKFVVTSLKASLEDNSYKAEFEAIANYALIKPDIDESVVRSSKIQPAIVVNNVDEEKLGRVQIQYLWDGEGSALAWARTIQAGAGGASGEDSYGTYFIPMVGDQVLVACENGDPSLPIVIGGMYHSESKPYYENEGATEYLLLRTPSKSMIFINDKEDGEAIQIDLCGGMGGIKVSNDGSGNPIINIDAPGGDIIVKAKNISFAADEKFEVEADSITMKSTSDTKLTVGNNYDLSVSSNATTKATGNVKSTSTGDTTIEATGSVDVKATVGAKMTSLNTEVSGSGMTTIKGGIVKIN